MFFNTAQNAVNFTWYNFFLALIFYSENMNCVIIPCAKFPLHTYIYTYIHIYIYIYIYVIFGLCTHFCICSGMFYHWNCSYHAGYNWGFCSFKV
jgi:hypothetical protein